MGNTGRGWSWLRSGGRGGGGEGEGEEGGGDEADTISNNPHLTGGGTKSEITSNICQKECQNNVSIHTRKFVRLKCHGGDHSKYFSKVLKHLGI